MRRVGGRGRRGRGVRLTYPGAVVAHHDIARRGHCGGGSRLSADRLQTTSCALRSRSATINAETFYSPSITYPAWWAAMPGLGSVVGSNVVVHRFLRNYGRRVSEGEAISTEAHRIKFLITECSISSSVPTDVSSRISSRGSGSAAEKELESRHPTATIDCLSEVLGRFFFLQTRCTQVTHSFVCVLEASIAVVSSRLGRARGAEVSCLSLLLLSHLTPLHVKSLVGRVLVRI